MATTRRIASAVLIFLTCASWNASVFSGRILWEHGKPPNKEVYCGDEKSPEIYFTVCSLASVTIKGTITQRLLELNWFNVIKKDGDLVAIFDRDPGVSMLPPVDSVQVDTLKDTVFRSKVQFPVQNFNGSVLTSECLGYWGAYFRKNMDVVAMTCVRTRPFWMSEIKEHIAGLNITSLMIPGTHDSGSYQAYKGWISENILTRFTYAQDEDIFTQLCFGIRSVDLRIGYYKGSDEKFWINHDFIRTPNPLSKVIDDVKKFLSLTKDEIVILDFHRFPEGFEDNTVHVLLIERLVKELGHAMIPNTMGYSATVGEILNSGKRVLVAYNSKAREGHELLWEEVSQKWGEENKVPLLKEYFEKIFSKVLPNKLWAAMAELTPTNADVILRPKLGLRYFADLINRNVTEWFRGEWGYKSNIIASDYYLGNNIIDTAIEINKRKGACSKKFSNNRVVTSVEKFSANWEASPLIKLIRSKSLSPDRYSYSH